MHIILAGSNIVASNEPNFYDDVKAAIVADRLLGGVGGDFVAPGPDSARLRARLEEAKYHVREFTLPYIGGQSQFITMIWPDDHQAYYLGDPEVITSAIYNSAELALIDVAYQLILKYPDKYPSQCITNHNRSNNDSAK